MSEYGLQLRKKKKQNSSTAFWRNLLLTITKRLTEWKDRLIENLDDPLELRLDNVLFRMGMARTRKEASCQIVDHKHVLVNGKQV